MRAFKKVSKVEPVIIKTSPHRPCDYTESAVLKVLEDRGLISDVKEDGVRLNLCVLEERDEKGAAYQVEWLSREGKRFPAMAVDFPLSFDERWKKFFNPHLGEGLFQGGFMLDAEILIDGAPAKITSGHLRRSEEIDPKRIRIVVFGIIPMSVILDGSEYDCTHSLMQVHVQYQVAKLKEFFPEFQWEVVESLDVFDEETMWALYEKTRAEGGEGRVLKDPNGNWLRSKRAGMWKQVPKDNMDGVVTGLIWGTPGKANAGKVIGFEVLTETGLTVNACKISQKEMEEFTHKVMTETFKAPEDFNWICPENEQEHCLNPYEGFAVKITFMEVYENGSLRHPTFDSFRGISQPLIKE